MKTMNQHHRRSIRLKEYDYSQPGEYFVTICTHNHECTLGEIINGEMRLNEIGKIVEEEWLRTAIIRPDIQLDLYVIMPNHIHGIIVLNEGRGTLKSNNPVGANCHSPQKETQNNPFNNGAYIDGAYNDTPLRNMFRSPSNTVGAIVRGFKSATTKRINEKRGASGIPFWQRNYYDRVIRSDNELNNIRDYIRNNVLQWAIKRDDPDNIPMW
jgi:REP element-mobilizing transposase RayT